MSKGLQVASMCVLLKNGIEIWVTEEYGRKVQEVLDQIAEHKFVRFKEGSRESINTAEVVGVFNPITLDEYHRRRNGQWKCQSSQWHDKGERCNCPDPEVVAHAAKVEAAYTKCKRGCNKGFVTVKNEQYPNGATGYCECIKALMIKK